jgi:hypothetical protein
MGTDRSRSTMRGLLVPDPRLAWWEDESGEYDAAGTRLSAIRSAGPVAGIPSSTSSSAMALRATGEQSAEVYVHVGRGGLPGTDGASVLWSPTGTAGTWRGCDLPCVITHWQSLLHVPGHSYRHPHLISAPDGRAWLLYYHATDQEVEVRVWDPDAATWGTAVTVASASADPFACLLRLPSGRLHCYHWRSAGSGHEQVALRWSDDDGATWTDAGDVLSVPISTGDYPVQLRLRAGYLAGQVLLVAHCRIPPAAYRDVLLQWCSSDGGMALDLVGAMTGGAVPADSGACPEIVVEDGQFLVGWLWEDTGPIVATWRRLGSASTWICAVPEWSSTGSIAAGQVWGTLAAGIITTPDLAAWVDDDGAIYCCGRASDGFAAARINILRSPDHGETWYGTGTSSHYVVPATGQAWWNQDGDEVAREFSGCASRGRSLVATSWDHLGLHTESIGVCVLGGWTRCTMPRRAGSAAPDYRTAWEEPEVGTHLPSDTARWTVHVVGGGAATHSAGRLHLVCGAGDQLYYDRTPAGTMAEGVIGEWALEWVDGTAHHRIRLSDATPHRYQADLRYDGTTITLRDDVGAADVATLAWSTHTLRLRLAMAGSSCRAWVRADGPAEDADWQPIGNTNALVDAANNPGNEITWGLFGQGELYYGEWHGVSDEYVGDQLLVAQGTSLLYPRSVLDSPVYAAYGTSLSAVTGPAFVGEEWEVQPDAEYPVSALDPRVEPSPRHPWRSRPHSEMDATTRTLRLAWALGTAAEDGLSDLWGVWLDGLNCAEIAVWLYYAGAWHQAATTSVDDLSTARSGGTLRLAGAVSGACTWRRGELDYAGVEGITIGPPDISDWRTTIAESIPGITRIGTGTSRTWACRLSSYDGGWSATPRVHLWPRRHLLLIRLSAYASQIRGVQLRLPVPVLPASLVPGVPAAGYWEIGTLAAGPVWVWGTDYSWGRSITHDPAQEIMTAEDGTRIVRVLGPIRRTVEVTWSDPVPMADALGSVAPDYVAYHVGGQAVALLRDTPLEVADELRVLQGAGTPVVYLPSIPQDSPGGMTSWGRGAVYGRIISAVAVETVQGEEEATELARVQRITIEEET